MDRSRGTTPVVSVVLMVAITIIVAATASVFAFGYVDDIREPAPQIARTTGEFVEQDGNSGGIAMITHKSGDTVSVEEIEILVQAECSDGVKQGRIINLPAGSGNDIDVDDGQIIGDNIFDERSLKTIDNAVEGINDGGALLNDRYRAGDTILFRIPASKCTLLRGNSVSVQIIHLPTQAVIIKKELTI